jgi:hypothetical protein
MRSAPGFAPSSKSLVFPLDSEVAAPSSGEKIVLGNCALEMGPMQFTAHANNELNQSSACGVR